MLVFHPIFGFFKKIKLFAPIKKSEYFIYTLTSPKLGIYVNTGAVFPCGENLLRLSILWSSLNEACRLQLTPVLTVL